jgi:CheY-like chemotaxis protein
MPVDVLIDSAADHRRRVLVVDDNIDAAELLAFALEDLGHDVRVAHDGAAAIETARAFHPDVAFVDLGLPVMDGLEVALRLRADPSLRETKLVALTGYSQDEDRARTRRAGFDFHLVKPVDLDRIAELASA